MYLFYSLKFLEDVACFCKEVKIFSITWSLNINISKLCQILACLDLRTVVVIP